jgi:CRP/FNR family cyclic AMP-dependent transcriptional regulator
MDTRLIPVNMAALLTAAAIAHTRGTYGPGDTIFTQGDRCDHVRFIETGAVTLSVMSITGKEGVTALLGVGDFLGEGGLAGQPSYTSTATALAASTIIAVGTHPMRRLLHEQPAMADRFIAHLLVRNIRSEANLVDHLFNVGEKRLARTLVLLAKYCTARAPDQVPLRISQETLGAMVGTTRSRINLFLQKFKKHGYVTYDRGAIIVHPSLLRVLLDSEDSTD